MSDVISTFFNAWALNSADGGAEMIAGVVTSDVTYDDPRTTETVNGVDALCEYVGMFSANAPGWSAKVLKRDVVAGVTRVTVAFGGLGPDGKEMVQNGQYFVVVEDDLISKMIGFVGTGES